MNHHTTPNYRLIEARFIGPTNYKGARLCIEQPSRYNDEKPQRRYFSYSHSIGNIEEQAYQILKANGWNIIGRCSVLKSYCFIVDNWGDDYLQIKDLK